MKRNKVLCLFIDDYCVNKNSKENCMNCHILKSFTKKVKNGRE
jgi:hypothetical protein